ncbi:MAG: DUF1574 domain-containing protein [Gemmataceae bacterium]|nr:DUF1574 domain-containing protein [Gemmataceae bacterium]
MNLTRVRQIAPQASRGPVLRLVGVVGDNLAPPADVRRKKQCARVQKARSALKWTLLALLGFHLGLAALLETVCPHWRDPEFGHRLQQLQRLQLLTEPRRPLVLILGTSRAQNGLQPAAMEFEQQPCSPLVFNFAQTGSPPLKVLLTFRRLIDAGIVPDAIVVEVLPLWLAIDAPAEVVFASSVERLTWRDLTYLAPYCHNQQRLQRQWLRRRLTPWWTQRSVLKSHWCPRWLPWNERVDPFWTGMMADGFMPFLYAEPTEDFRQRAQAHARLEYAYAFQGFRFTSGCLSAVAELVSLCRQHGVAVAFVEPPTAGQFRSWFAPGVWEHGRQQLFNLAQQWNVPLFPAELPLEDHEFADGHHLLRSGAARYSRWLAERYLRPWLQAEGILTSASSPPVPVTTQKLRHP